MNIFKHINHLNKKKIYCVLFIICLASFCYIASYNIITIPTDTPPLSDGNYEAMFYIQNEETGTMTCIGDGLISSPSEIAKNNEAVSSLIVSAPDYSNYLSSSLTISWDTITKADDGFRVVGSIVSSDSPSGNAKQNIFANVEDLKNATVSNGDTVSTLGFYEANDGGGATYTITNTGKIDGKFNIILNNGLIAQLKVNNNTILVDQLGAKGDGINDDVSFIQTAFDSKYTVTFSPNKIYKLVTNGLAIRNNLNIVGNNATILVDDSYNPTSSNFQKNIIRSGFDSIDNINIESLTLRCDMNTKRYSGNNYLCMFQPSFSDNISLRNFDIEISESDNVITNFWMYYGCDNLILENCNFINNTTAGEGGIIFLHSRDDNYYNYYNAFKNISITNCNFKGQCGDEAIALWGPNDINCKVSSTTIDWNIANKNKSSRPIAITCNEDTVAKYNIIFENCNISANSKSADSIIGVGSRTPSNINLTFRSCSINANVRDSLLHFQLLPSTPAGISDFEFIDDKYNIAFESCTINCSKTITGSSNLYNSESVNNWAIDCDFNNCNINCNYCFAFLERYSTSKYYYVPTINVNSCTINISNDIGVIFKTTKGANINANIVNTNMNAPNINDVTKYRYKVDTNSGLTQSNITNTTIDIKKSYLNSKAVN